jgi:hypothetical protein
MVLATPFDNRYSNDNWRATEIEVAESVRITNGSFGVVGESFSLAPEFIPGIAREDDGREPFQRFPSVGQRNANR